mgnify:CR=1 FL=1
MDKEYLEAAGCLKSGPLGAMLGAGILDSATYAWKHGFGCVIAEDFQHGENFECGHYCIIEEGCQVGDDVRLGDFVLLRSGTVIGDRTFVDAYVKSSGNNRIGSDVILRFNATIAREVTVEDGAFVSPNVMTIYSTHERERRGGTVIGWL